MLQNFSQDFFCRQHPVNICGWYLNFCLCVGKCSGTYMHTVDMYGRYGIYRYHTYRPARTLSWLNAGMPDTLLAFTASAMHRTYQCTGRYGNYLHTYFRFPSYIGTGTVQCHSHHQRIAALLDGFRPIKGTVAPDFRGPYYRWMHFKSVELRYWYLPYLFRSWTSGIDDTCQKRHKKSGATVPSTKKITVVMIKNRFGP